MSTHTESPDHDQSPRAAISHRNAELIVGALMVAFGLLVIVSNYRIGAGWSDTGPQAGYFPLRMGVFILIASIAVIYQAIRRNDRSSFVDREQLKLVSIVFFPLVVYVGVLEFLGIYVASALFIGLFMRFVGKFAWWKAVVVGVGINLVLFWVFEVQFLVPLPKGPVESLFGY